MKKELIIGLCALMIVLSGCSDGTDIEDVEALKAKIIDVNSKVDSYEIEMNMGMSMKTTGAPTDLDITMSMDSEGMVNQKSKEMYLKMTISSNMGMLEGMETEMYVLGDYTYTKMMESWTKTKTEDDIWNQQDKMQSTMDMLEDAEIEVLEPSNANNQIVIKIIPDSKKIALAALAQSQSDGMIDDSRNIDYEKMIQGVTFTLWINKNSYIIEKQYMKMDLYMDTEVLDIEEKDDVKMDMSIEMTVEISNIGNVKQIVLPEEAKEAMDITSYMGGSGSGMGMATGGAIADVFG